MRTPADRLKEALKELGKENQSLVAFDLGYSSSQISDILKNKKTLTRRFSRIANLKYAINETWLMTGEGEMFDRKKTVSVVSESREPYQANSIDHDQGLINLIVKSQLAQNLEIAELKKQLEMIKKNINSTERDPPHSSPGMIDDPEGGGGASGSSEKKVM